MAYMPAPVEWPRELAIYMMQSISVDDWASLCATSRAQQRAFCHLDCWQASATFREATLEGRNVQKLLYPYFAGGNVIKFHGFAVRLYRVHHPSLSPAFAEARADSWVLREMARRFFEHANYKGQKAFFNAMGPAFRQQVLPPNFPPTMREFHYSVTNTFYAKEDTLRAGLLAANALEALSIEGVVNVSESVSACIQKHRFSLRTLSLSNGAWGQRALVAALEEPMRIEELNLRDQYAVDDDVCRLIATQHQNLRCVAVGGSELLGRAANLLTDAGVEALAELPHLEHFSIGCADNVTAASLAIMAAAVQSLHMEKLARLDRDSCYVLAPYLSNLRTLRLGPSRRFDSTGLHALLSQARALQELRLDSWGMSSLSLRTIIQDLPNLERLIIYERLRENSADLAPLAELFPGLEVVLVTNQEVHCSLLPDGGDAVLGGEMLGRGSGEV